MDMARILVIEDADWARKYVADVLQDSGHEVIAMDDSAEAIKKFSEEEFDIVITDIFMPEKDGFDVMTAVKRLKKTPKVVAISGGSAAMSADIALSSASHMSADVCLKKPFRPEDLKSAVAKILI